MRCVAGVALILSLASSSAGAQTTLCSPVGNMVMCDTTPAPPNYNQQYSGAAAGFGAALGAFIRRQADRPRPVASPVSVAAETEEQRIARAIQEFAADPAHPYFGIVRRRMAELIKAGRAEGLADSYALAVAEITVPTADAAAAH